MQIFVAHQTLESHAAKHGEDFVHAIIAAADAWVPLSGVYIDGDKYQKLLNDPASAPRAAFDRKVQESRASPDAGPAPPALSAFSDPVPFGDWPKWAKLVSHRREPKDVGVGQTFKRLAARFGGDKYKRLMKWLGVPCRCSDREAEWNRLYPYPTEPGGDLPISE